MKLTIPTILMALTLTAAAGCRSGVKTATIVAPEGSTTAPKPATDGKSSSEEIIAPKTETPSSPAPIDPAPVSKDSPAPAPAPETPSGKTEDPTAPKDGDKTGKAAPDPVIITWISPVAPTPKKTLKLVATKNIHTVTCENCGGAGGEVHDYQCPRNYVVTGYNRGSAQFGECPDDTSGCGDHVVVGGLQILCRPLTALNIDPDPERASEAYDYTDTTRMTAGTAALDVSDHCADWSGVATGIFGRGGERLDSFGYECGTYSPTDVNASIYQSSLAKKATSNAGDTYPDLPFSGAPGYGGNPFSLSCPQGQALVGVAVRSGLDVDGIASIDCAQLEPILN